MKLIGRCLCAGVELHLHALPGALVYCHCSQCRKSAGAPFLTVMPIGSADFTLIDDAELVREYRASPTKLRAFCGRCGSPLYSKRDDHDQVRVRAGLFEHLDGVARGGHIFDADSVAWYAEGDGLPRYAGLEPGRDGSPGR